MNSRRRVLELAHLVRLIADAFGETALALGVAADPVHHRAAVDTLLDEFAQKADPAEKGKRLIRVFAGVFEIINGERSTVMNGILGGDLGGVGFRAVLELAHLVRLIADAFGETALAPERIRDEADKVSEFKDSPESDSTKVASKEVADLESRFNWDRRIFDETESGSEMRLDAAGNLAQALLQNRRDLADVGDRLVALVEDAAVPVEPAFQVRDLLGGDLGGVRIQAHL
jgi:hypothetical protein